jgi:hypothetical protein
VTVVVASDEIFRGQTSVTLGDGSGEVLGADWCGLRTSSTAAFVVTSENDGPPPSEWRDMLGGSVSEELLSALFELNRTSRLDQPTNRVFGGLFSGVFSRRLTIRDRTGGLAVPLTNRMQPQSVRAALLRGLDSSSGTFAVRVCSIVEIVPYVGMAVGGWFPVYQTRDAVLEAEGSGASTVTVAGVDYFFPDSALGVRCSPSGSGGSLRFNDPVCVEAIAESAKKKRRSLLSGARVRTAAGMTSAVIFTPPPKTPPPPFPPPLTGVLLAPVSASTLPPSPAKGSAVEKASGLDDVSVTRTGFVIVATVVTAVVSGLLACGAAYFCSRSRRRAISNVALKRINSRVHPIRQEVSESSSTSSASSIGPFFNVFGVTSTTAGRLFEKETLHLPEPRSAVLARKTGDIKVVPIGKLSYIAWPAKQE